MKRANWLGVYTVEPFLNAESQSAGRADDMLRWLVNEGAGSESTGTTEGHPFGHVTLLNVPRATVAAYVNGHGEPWLSEARNFEPGWYLVQETTLGLIYGYRYVDETTARVDLITMQRFNESFEALAEVES